MTPSDFHPGMTLADEAGHTYLVLDAKADTYTRHSQHLRAEILVRRLADNVERWVWGTTAAKMAQEGKLKVVA